VTAVFDNDPTKIGTKVGDMIVQPVDELEETLREQDIRIGVIAVPPEAAQTVADQLAAAGIRIILNYTPVIVRAPEDVTIHNTDPVQELLHTLYYLSRREGVARV